MWLSKVLVGVSYHPYVGHAHVFFVKDRSRSNAWSKALHDRNNLAIDSSSGFFKHHLKPNLRDIESMLYWRHGFKWLLKVSELDSIATLLLSWSAFDPTLAILTFDLYVMRLYGPWRSRKKAYAHLFVLRCSSKTWKTSTKIATFPLGIHYAIYPIVLSICVR